MKNKKFILALSALLLVACASNVSTSNDTSNTSSQVTTEKVTTSETTTEKVTTSEVTTSDTSLTTENQDTHSSSSYVTSSEDKSLAQIALEQLKTGFKVSTTYQGQYDDGNPSFRYTQTELGNEVLKFKRFTNDTKSVVSESAIYQKDDTGLAVSAYLNIDGSVGEQKLQILNPLLDVDDDITYDEAGFNNIFDELSIEDFVIDENTNKMTLTFQEENDDKLARIASNLKIQLFTIVEAELNHHFYNGNLENFTLTYSEEGQPLTYIAKFFDENRDDGWGGVSIYKSSLEGTFDEFNLDETLKKIEKVEEIDQNFKAKMDSLKTQNYEASYKRSYEDDWYGAGVEAEGKVISDGISGFEVTNAQNNKITGYRQVEETKYQKYEVNQDIVTLSGEQVEGKVEDLLPTFTINSYFFQKDEAQSIGKEVYKFILVDEMSIKPYVSLFCGFDGAISVANVFTDLTITFEDDKIIFNNVSGIYTQTITYSNIGNVSQITRQL